MGAVPPWVPLEAVAPDVGGAVGVGNGVPELGVKVFNGSVGKGVRARSAAARCTTSQPSAATATSPASTPRTMRTRRRLASAKRRAACWRSHRARAS